MIGRAGAHYNPRHRLAPTAHEKSDAAPRRTAHRARPRAPDEELAVPWTLKRGGQALFTFPRAACVRSFVMNHMIHHRGQLTVYLRMCDVPLPPVYGPTADVTGAVLAARAHA